MIYTLTLNPAIDRTVEVNNLKVGGLNRVESTRSDASGKGINVSKVIRALHGNSTCLGFLGGSNGEFIRKKINQMEINESFVEINQNTRMNIKVVDKKEKHVTELNEKGPIIKEKELDSLKNLLKSQIEEGDILAISGSAPPNLSESIYREIIELLPQNVKVILDTDGPLLEEAIKAKPYMIKPNIHEFQRLTNSESNSLRELIDLGENVQRNGPDTILLTMGEKGAIFFGKKEIYKIDAIPIEVKSSIGAGDAMVGGVVFSISRSKPIVEALKVATACAAASVSMEGTQPGPKNRVNELKSKVKIKKVDKDEIK